MLPFLNRFPYPWKQVFVITCFGIKFLHQKLVRLVIIYIQKISVNSKKYIGTKKSHSLISIQKWMVH